MNNTLLIASFLQKINKVVDLKKVNKSKMCEDLGIGRTTLYAYLDGTSDMPLSLFLKVCDYLDIELVIDEASGLDKAFNSLKKEIIGYIDSKVS